MRYLIPILLGIIFIAAAVYVWRPLRSSSGANDARGGGSGDGRDQQ